MKTVKELKDFLENMPDEAILIAKVLIDGDFVYYDDLDVYNDKMSRLNPSSMRWQFDSNGHPCVIFY